MADKAPRIISLQVGKPQTVRTDETTESHTQEWTTGFFKQSTAESLWLGRLNLDGDGQADLENHGGPEKAVNVYPVEHFPYWAHTIQMSMLSPGSFGENLTTQGLMETDVCIGDVFEVGNSLVQISQPRQPCWKLARRWGVKDLAVQVQETGRTGWYFRVLREGQVQAGNELILVERHHPHWTVSAANEVMHHRTNDRQAAQDLSGCIHLSLRWRDKLKKRVLTGAPENTASRLDGPEDVKK